MKIGFVMEAPTQFEAPFFRHISKDVNHSVRVIYTNALRMNTKIFDKEIGKYLEWGIDLLSGYDYATMPEHDRLQWCKSEILAGKYDFIVINGYYTSSYRIATIQAFWQKIPIALRLDTVQFSNSSIIRIIFKKILFFGLDNLYCRFLAVSSWTVSFLLGQGVPPSKIFKFPYAIDDNYFREKSSLAEFDRHNLFSRHGLPPTSRIVLAVAKLHPRESPWDLLRAFCELKLNDIALVIVGDGPEANSMRVYANENPSRLIRFVGYVPYLELPSYYAIANLFVHTAIDEPWGVSIAEAMACGLPVITSSRVGAGHDLIAEGVNGYIYPTGDVQALQKFLIKVFTELNSEQVQIANKEALLKHNYNATWENILAAIK